jgi:hypothetical protein
MRKLKLGLRPQLPRNLDRHFVTKSKSEFFPTKDADFDLDERYPKVQLPSVHTRISPFFPIRHRDRTNKIMPTPFVVTNSWGRMEIVGYRLNDYDRLIFLALLHLADKVGWGDGLSNRIYTCTAELYSLLSKNLVSSSTIQYVFNSLQRMHRTTCEVRLVGQKENSMKGSLLIGDYSDDQLVLRVNGAYKLDLAHGTSLDLKFLYDISSSLAVGWYIFLSSQQSFYTQGSYKIGLLKLCAAINLIWVESDLHGSIVNYGRYVDQPVRKFSLRQQVKNAFKELQVIGFLDSKDPYTMKDDVYTIRRGTKG